MLSFFKYKGFEPSELIRDSAQKCVHELSEFISAGSIVVGRLEFNDTEYACSFHVFHRTESIDITSTHPDPITAINHTTAEFKSTLEEKGKGPKSHLTVYQRKLLKQTAGLRPFT